MIAFNYLSRYTNPTCQYYCTTIFYHWPILWYIWYINYHLYNVTIYTIYTILTYIIVCINVYSWFVYFQWLNWNYREIIIIRTVQVIQRCSTLLFCGIQEKHKSTRGPARAQIQALWEPSKHNARHGFLNRSRSICTVISVARQRARALHMYAPRTDVHTWCTSR